jgi:hypothetical protein
VLPEDRNARTWNTARMPLRHSGSPTPARTAPPEVSSEWASSHLNASLDVRSHPYSPVSSETAYSHLFARTSNPNTGSSPHTNASRTLPALTRLALPAHGRTLARAPTPPAATPQSAAAHNDRTSNSDEHRRAVRQPRLCFWPAASPASPRRCSRAGTQGPYPRRQRHGSMEPILGELTPTRGRRTDELSLQRRSALRFAARLLSLASS